MTWKLPKRTIGLFALMCLLLLGICFESIQTDSLSVYASADLSDSLSAHPESAITCAQKSFPIRQFIPEKTSGSQPAVVNTRRSIGKAGSRLNRVRFDFLYTVQALFQNNFSLHTYINHGISFHFPNHIIIIHYIHLQDGQKSAFLFS